MKKEITNETKLKLIHQLISQLESEEFPLFISEQDRQINKIENLENNLNKEDLLNYLDELFSAIAEPAVDIFLEENLQEQE